MNGHMAIKIRIVEYADKRRCVCVCVCVRTSLFAFSSYYIYDSDLVLECGSDGT